MNVLTKLGVSYLWQKVKAYVDNQISSLRNTVYSRDQSLAQSIEEISPKEYTFATNTYNAIPRFNGELLKSFASVKVGDTITGTDVAGTTRCTVVAVYGNDLDGRFIHAIGANSDRPSVFVFSIADTGATYGTYAKYELASTYATEGLDTRVSELESKLATLESTVESNHTAAIAETKKYLPLTGGTLTGALTIKMNYPQLTLQQTGGAGVRITTGSKGENFDLKTLAGGYVTTVVGDLNFKTGGWLTYNADTGQFSFNKTVAAPNIPAASAASLDESAFAAFDTPEADAEVQEA